MRLTPRWRWWTGWGWARRVAPMATRAELEAVHDAELVDMIERLVARGGGGLIDADTHVDAAAIALRAMPAARRARWGPAGVSVEDSYTDGTRSTRWASCRIKQKPR